VVCEVVFCMEVRPGCKKRCMCGVKLQDRIPSKGLRERLGLDDMISVLQENR